MALALYRKYRPRTFAEVIGQEHVTEPLTQALRSGRLNHAYLFSGPRGCGKTSSARILARSLNCEQGPTPEPCGECDSCRSLATDGGSIDVMEIDAASHGGVDDARELRERAFFAPVSSRFKIYVIDEAHMVSTQGFNALLKLVEEPPEYVKFIFATTEPEKVLGTIKSRTHHYPFRLIPPGVLRPYLEHLASAEGIKVDPAVFPLVVRAGGGSARDSLSVLDQLIAGAGPEGVEYARAVALLGVTDAALIDEMCDALAAGDGAAAYATVDRVAEAGHDPRRFASDLLERLRDLMVLQQVPEAATKGLVDGPTDQIERMSAQAQRLGPGTLSRCADLVHNGLVEMRGTTAPRLLLELICARMLLPGADDSAGGLLQRLERMERRLSDGPLPATAGPAPAAVRSAPAPAPAMSPAPPTERPTVAAPAERPTPAAPSPADPVPAAEPIRRPAPPETVTPNVGTAEPAPSGALDAVAVRRAWNDIVGMVNRSHKKIAALMRDAVVRDLEGDTLLLTVKSSVLAKMLSDASGVITAALYEELGGRWQIRCEVAGDQRSATPAAPARPANPTPPVGGGAGPRGDQRSAAGPAPAHGSASTAGDGDWPEAARPGGGAATVAGAGAGDWPEPARPGGTAATGSGGTPTAAVPAGAGTAAVPAGHAGSDLAAPGPGGAVGGNGAPAPSAGLAAARAAAAGRGPRTPAANRTADRDWAGEPPYDPEYDGQPQTGADYQGFDPGDEPLDDDEVIDERTARQTSEQQALQLLQQTLGAERIGEVDAK